MIQKILAILATLILFAASTASAAEDIEINYEPNIASGTEFSLDLSNLEDELEQQYDTNVLFEWDIRGASTKRGSSFVRTFESYGEKEINLTIYRTLAGQKNLIHSKNISVFVYSSSIPFLYDEGISNVQRSNFDQIARQSGIYIYNLGIQNSKNIDGNKIIESLGRYENIPGDRSNYIGVWGGKEFILNATGQINKQANIKEYNRDLNLAIFSSFNKDVLRNFVGNFLSDKSSMDSIIISEETTRLQALEQPLKIKALTDHLNDNNHEYTTVGTKDRIKSLLFISKFVNNLSSAGFQASSIYLIIIIPILLLGLSIMKHIIGFSPLGVMIPVGITLLFFQVGLITTIIMLVSLFIINIILGKVISQYTLLYTPKASLILGINIVFIIAILNLLFQYNLVGTNVESIIFIILFVLIIEKLITLIIGKEFREYKYNLLYTLAFAIVSYTLFQFDTIQIFLLAYPEIILVLIPINFWIGQFTGLRMTEYLRFREIIHNIEEEE